MHFICIYLLALLHIFEYTKKTELYPAIGKEELFQMLYSKNKKRGFTLVELIVVLVILAILAALLIPALTGYIDKAKKDQVIAETRMLHEAVQTEMAEIYGSNVAWKQQNLSILASDRSTPIDGWKFLGSQTDAKNRYDEIVKLAEIPSSAKFLILVNGQAKIHAIIYNSGRGYIGVYFQDTQQYAAYKLGTATEYGTVDDSTYNAPYYSSVLYNWAVDAPRDENGKYNDPNAYWWSCDAIRAALGIGKWDPPKT